MVMDKVKEGIINSVYLKPALWDKNHKDHRNRWLLEKYWTSICEDLHLTTEHKKVVKSIWRSLRQEFGKRLYQKSMRVEYTLPHCLAPNPSDWQYFNALYFLRDQFAIRPLSGLQEGADNQVYSPIPLHSIHMDNVKEIVINAVYMKPILWDKHHKDHHNRWLLDRTWKNISRDLHLNEKVVKSVWKNLRIQYGKQLKKNSIKTDNSVQPRLASEWQYFYSMSFLRDQFEPRLSMKDWIGLEGEIVDAQVFSPMRLLSPRYEDSSSLTTDDGSASGTHMNDNGKRPWDEVAAIRAQFAAPGDKLDDKKAAREEPQDDGMAFLYSLLPGFKALGAKKQLVFKVRVQQLMLDLTYADNFGSD